MTAMKTNQAHQGTGNELESEITSMVQLGPTNNTWTTPPVTPANRESF